MYGHSIHQYVLVFFKKRMRNQLKIEKLEENEAAKGKRGNELGEEGRRRRRNDAKGEGRTRQRRERGLEATT